MSLSFRPINSIEPINRSLFDRFSSDRRHRSTIGSLLIPDCLVSPRLIGGVVTEWAISSYDVGYGISYGSVTRLSFCFNSYYFMCLCVSQAPERIDPSLKTILPDRRIPYDRLIPRSAGRYRC